MKIIHHGVAKGVTESCHELWIDDARSVLIDCGLFQGYDVSKTLTETEQLKIDFPIETIEALIVTHCHIDHVGWLPYHLMAGFEKKILCSVATAQLIPLVLEDALKIGFTRDAKLIASFLRKVETLLMPPALRKWVVLAGCKADYIRLVIFQGPPLSKFKLVWVCKAKRQEQRGPHPLSFEKLLTIKDQQEPLRTVDYLKQSGRPAIVIAASGMCSGGRIVNYLKALIADPRTDILFVGYQAKGDHRAENSKVRSQKRVCPD